jgi:hypothetical protein
VYSRAADTRSEDHPARHAPRYMGRLIARISGKRSQLRVPRSRLPGEERADRYKNAGYDASTEAAMNPEIPVMSQKNRQGLSMKDRKIIGDAAIHRAVE